jgi:hypothetical protein
VFGSIESARAAIEKLVERYRANRDRYQAASYNEETARGEFISPFFNALGWDVYNTEGLAEQYKDVIHEEGIKIGDFTKAPDYTFRVGGVRKFFVEAKKPFVDLGADPAPAYQLRRYAWSAKLPLSILTDFEELAVYDTRIRPREGDKPSVSRILSYGYEDFLPKLEEIWGIFSKDAVLKGSFDRYAVESRGKRGTSEVDAEFLKEIEGWREELAKTIALRNPDLSADDLNFAVQTTIDRVIFLRIAEARGAEVYGGLLGLTGGPDIYPRLVEAYRSADGRYNSGLFDFRTDKLTTQLVIDDRVLKPILKGLYYPESPYEFSVLPAEILGNVYEQFLGRVIRLTKGHHAVIEEKPEVRKAGGVYYTPADIVQRIVKTTLGPLCEGKSPKQMKAIRVLDPACGSGSFLLAAYQFLLDAHLAWFLRHEPERHKKEVYLGFGAQWRLTTGEKRAILLSSVFGVDIDRQAVEVTKLSLLLKVLEGETDETLRQSWLFGVRALPSLEENIKCGNSLIPTKALGGLFPDPDEMKRINPFDWEREFSKQLQDGGFDVVVGNPPYIRIQMMQEWAPREVELYKTLYRTAASGNYDIYVVFVEKGLSLLSPGGRLGFILPHKFFNAKYGEGLRELVAKGRHLSEVVHFGDQQVFEDATTYTCLLFLNRTPSKAVHVSKVHDIGLWRKDGTAITGSVRAASLGKEEWHFAIGGSASLVARLGSLPTTLASIADRIFQGLITGADPVFLLIQEGRGRYRSEALDAVVALEPDLLHPLCKGSLDIRRYLIDDPQRVILFPYSLTEDGAHLIPKDEFPKRYSKTWAYLQANRETLQSRERGKWKHERWYAFGRSQNLAEMQQVKLLTPSIAKQASFVLDPGGRYYFVGSGGGGGGGYGVTLKPGLGLDYHFVLSLLNSRLLDFYLKAISSPFSHGYYAYNRQYIERLPIAGLGDVAAQKALAKLAESAMSVRSALAAAKTPHERTRLERQIDATDREIDRLVYGLYGLSLSEIELVEKETMPRAAAAHSG